MVPPSQTRHAGSRVVTPSRFGHHGRPARLLDADGQPRALLDLGVADGFRLRLFGLMGRAPLRQAPRCEALLLRHCRSVHCCFMRAPIDLAFLDEAHRVVAVRARLCPWRMHTAAAPARHTLELPEGALARWGIGPGHRLDWR